ncbi:MAG: hypothetical protein J6D46_02930, partial [Lachnospiraceae bacterium]|nr:hypothetical protein [Lachnospiraceae bacterium]
QSAYFNPGDLGAQHYEPESICELEPGVFLMPVTATGYDGSMHVYFYRTVMPYYFTIEVTTQTVDAESMSDPENEDLPYNGETMKADLAKTSAASDGKRTDLTKASAVSGGTVTTEVVKPADALAGKEKADQAKAASVKSGLAGSDEYEASARAAVMEDTGGSVTEGSAQVLRGTGYAVNYIPNEGYETASVFVDGEEIDLAEYPDRYVIENIQENHTVDVTFAVKPTPVPTPTEEPQEITKPDQASGGDASENGDISDEHTDASGTDAEKEESSKKASGGFIAGIGGVFSSIGQLIKGAFAVVGGLFAGIGSLIMRGLRAVGAFFAGIPKFFSKPVAKGGKSVGSVVIKILLVVLLLLLASLGLTAVHVQRVRKKKAEESKRRRARVRRQLEEEIEAIDIDSIPVPPPTWQKPVTGKQNTARKQQSQKRKRNKNQ